MPQLARKIEQALISFLPGRAPVGPKTPANDNVSAAALADYVRDVRCRAGGEYAPAHARQWWLP